jgi:hypothetical protein
METLTTDAINEDRVPDRCKCPHCGEARMDFLALDEDDWVTWQTCLAEYPIWKKPGFDQRLLRQPSPFWDNSAF